MGDEARALGAAEEAVELARVRVREEPSERPLLATCLANRAGVLLSAERFEEVISTAREAIRLLRELAERGGFERELASCRNNQGLAYHRLEKLDEAERSFREGIARLRPRGEQSPETHEPLPATVLLNLAITLGASGRSGAALAATEEALAIRESLFLCERETYGPDLVVAYHNRSRKLWGLGRDSKAFEASETAIRLLGPATSKGPRTTART